nr:hypothetical protein [Asanoa siamensis]
MDVDGHRESVGVWVDVEGVAEPVDQPQSAASGNVGSGLGDGRDDGRTAVVGDAARDGRVVGGKVEAAAAPAVTDRVGEQFVDGDDDIFGQVSFDAGVV